MQKELINSLLFILIITNSCLADLIHFKDFSSTTGTSRMYAGRVFISGYEAAINEDEVGVFVEGDKGKHILIGAGIVQKLTDEYPACYSMEVYGNNSSTSIKDGANIDDRLFFRVWDKSADIEYFIYENDIQIEAYENLEQPQLPVLWKNQNSSFGLINLYAKPPGLRDVIRILKELAR